MLSGETMMSICKTLETIDFCCNRDAYSDAYTLLRKYYNGLSLTPKGAFGERHPKIVV